VSVTQPVGSCARPAKPAVLDVPGPSHPSLHLTPGGVPLGQAGPVAGLMTCAWRQGTTVGIGDVSRCGPLLLSCDVRVDVGAVVDQAAPWQVSVGDVPRA
jgi:hypothetical protein